MAYTSKDSWEDGISTIRKAKVWYHLHHSSLECMRMKYACVLNVARVSTLQTTKTRHALAGKYTTWFSNAVKDTMCALTINSCTNWAINVNNLRKICSWSQASPQTQMKSRKKIVYFCNSRTCLNSKKCSSVHMARKHPKSRQNSEACWTKATLK